VGWNSKSSCAMGSMDSSPQETAGCGECVLVCSTSQPSGPVQATGFMPARRPPAIPRGKRISLTGLSGVQLWDLQHPHLYTVHVRLLRGPDTSVMRIPPHRLPRSDVTIHGSSLMERSSSWRDWTGLRRFRLVGQAMAARWCHRGKCDSVSQWFCTCTIIVRTSITRSPRTLFWMLSTMRRAAWTGRDPRLAATSATEEWKQVAVDNVEAA